MMCLKWFRVCVWDLLCFLWFCIVLAVTPLQFITILVGLYEVFCVSHDCVFRALLNRCVWDPHRASLMVSWSFIKEETSWTQKGDLCYQLDVYSTIYKGCSDSLYCREYHIMIFVFVKVLLMYKHSDITVYSCIIYVANFAKEHVVRSWLMCACWKGSLLLLLI